MAGASRGEYPGWLRSGVDSVKRRPKEIPVSSFMHRIRKADRDADVDELRTAVESALAGICAFNLSIDARWVVEALAVMRQEWRGQPRWKWLYATWAEFLDVLQIDSELERWFDEIVSAKPDTTLGEALDAARQLRAAERVQAAAVKTTGKVLPSDGSVNQWVGKLPAHLTQDARAEAAGVSTRTQKKLDALARRAPELLAAVREGRMTAHAAAKAAGIVKEKSTVEKLSALWAKATIEERQAFLASIQNANF